MNLFKLVGTIAINNTDANDAIDDTTDKTQSSENKMVSAFKKVGAAVATYFAVDKIIGFGKSCVDAAADAQASSSQFTQVFGDMEGDASKSLGKIADDAGILETRMKGSYTKIAAFAKTTGMDTKDAMDLSNRAMVAVADSAAFYDRSLEDTTESLQSFLKGNYENDAALGLSCTETTRNEAANNLYGKSFKDLSEAQKQLTLLQMVEDANKTSGALGQAARESDTWTNQTGNLKQAWTDFKAVIGENFLDVAVEGVKKASEIVQTLSEKVQNAKQYYDNFKQSIQDAQAWVQQHSTGLAMLGIALGTITTAVVAYNAAAITKKALDLAETVQIGLLIAADYAHAVASGVAAAATTAFGTAVAFLTSPITLVIAAIGALIAIGVLLYQNWDTVKEKCSELVQNLGEKWESIKNSIGEKVEAIKQGISEKFSQMKESMSTIMQAAKDTVSEKLQNMKNAYNEHGGGIKGIAAAAMEGVKGYYSAGYTFIDNLTGGKLSEVANKFKSKMGEAKQAVSDKIGEIKSFFSNGLSNARDTVSNILGSIKEKFSSIMEGAKNIVSNAIERIKGFFNFSWSLPRLEMPHPTISGSFSLNPPSAPQFGISWYKKAMDEPYMFTDPTLFDYNPVTGSARGAGEAGDEMMYGRSSLMGDIGEVVANQNNGVIQVIEDMFNKLFDILEMYFPEFTKSLVLDTGVLVAETAEQYDDALGIIKKRKERG